MTTTIAYIDGFNLYHGLRSKFGRRYLWLDLFALVRQLRPADDLLIVRYFTARVRGDPPALHRQQTYLDALRAHCGPRLEIVEGRFQMKNLCCRACKASWTQYEEKETDVNPPNCRTPPSAATTRVRRRPSRPPSIVDPSIVDAV